MVNHCAQFLKKKGLKFSTHADPAKSKTKCIIFSKKPKDRRNVVPVKLNEDVLPWVDEVKHLGNILEYNNSMERDIAVNRGKFIGKLNSIMSLQTHLSRFSTSRLLVSMAVVSGISSHLTVKDSTLPGMLLSSMPGVFQTQHIDI